MASSTTTADALIPSRTPSDESYLSHEHGLLSWIYVIYYAIAY